MKKDKRNTKEDIYIPLLLEKLDNTDIKDRVAHELFFYYKQACFHKKFYYVCTIINILIPLCVAIINVWPGTVFTIQTFLTTSLSSLTAGTAGILAAVNSRNHWNTYRAGCEALKHEIFKYSARVSPYNIKESAKRQEIFINHFEEIVQKVSKGWNINIKLEENQ